MLFSYQEKLTDGAIHPSRWSSERKDGSLQSWKLTQEMVSATIKLAMATNRLSDKREENEREPRAGEFADDGEICADEQVPYAEGDLNT